MSEWVSGLINGVYPILFGIKVLERQSPAREGELLSKEGDIHREITSIQFWGCQIGDWKGENAAQELIKSLQVMGDYTSLRNADIILQGWGVMGEKTDLGIPWFKRVILVDAFSLQS